MVLQQGCMMSPLPFNLLMIEMMQEVNLRVYRERGRYIVCHGWVYV